MDLDKYLITLNLKWICIWRYRIKKGVHIILGKVFTNDSRPVKRTEGKRDALIEINEELKRSKVGSRPVRFSIHTKCEKEKNFL